MHTDYVVWYLPTISCPPPSLIHRLVWGLWVLLCLTACGWGICGVYVDCIGYYGYGMRMCYTHCGVYMGCIWDVYGRIELLRILRVGAPACGAHPPCLALPASEQNPSIEYKNKTNSDTTATITSQTAHRLYTYTLHNIYYRTL